MNWATSTTSNKKFKGVRRRKWGKWVSEIRVPRTQERLWLGTYATPEAAAVAHDVAVYCLRKPSNLEKLNFPETLFSYCIQQRDHDLMSPRSVQKVASDVAMDVDARKIASETMTTTLVENNHVSENKNVFAGDYDNDDEFLWDGFCDDFSLKEVGEDCSQQKECLSISVDDYL